MLFEAIIKAWLREPLCGVCPVDPAWRPYRQFESPLPHQRDAPGLCKISSSQFFSSSLTSVLTRFSDSTQTSREVRFGPRSGHHDRAETCPLTGAQRTQTRRLHCRFMTWSLAAMPQELEHASGHRWQIVLAWPERVRIVLQQGCVEAGWQATPLPELSRAQ